MEMTVLGSGGNSPTPMPTCDCRVCVEAREQGVPYARRGNSMFVHDANLLVDTPELVWHSLNRAGIESVEYVFLSHFHADHTLGLRALQALGMEDQPITDFVGEVPTLLMSPVTHERVVEDNTVFEHLAQRWGDIEILEDGDSRSLGGLELTHRSAPIQEGGENAISALLLEDERGTAFLSPDENRHLDVESLPALELWVKETGYFPETPEGDRTVTEAAERTALAAEMTFEESLAQVRAVRPERTVFTEIEEQYRRSYDDYRALARELSAEEGLDVTFAHDGMTLSV
jgi:phosphoribosyl 1,2-cyclic phosphate phosphodiesterase